jgi:predicted ATP-dependent serine protease
MPFGFHLSKRLYKCKCGHVFKEYVGVNRCPKCNAWRPKRVKLGYQGELIQQANAGI